MIRRFITVGLLLILAGSVTAQTVTEPTSITANNADQVQFASEIAVVDVVNDLVFSPDGTLLVTAGNDTSVRVWSLEDNSQVTESFEHFSFVKAAAFTESVLATAGWDRTVITWTLESGALTPQATFTGYDAVIEHLAISPDGAHIAFGVGDGRVRVADAATGEVLHELPVGSLRVSAVAYSPDGAQIATAGGFPTTGAQVWDAEGGLQTAVLAHPGIVTALAYSPDGAVLAAAGNDGTVSLWQTHALIASIAVEEWVTDIAFSLDGSVLVAARQDGVVTFWDVSDATAPTLVIALIAADESINAIAFSADGTRLATASDDGSLRLWQIP